MPGKYHAVRNLSLLFLCLIFIGQTTPTKIDWNDYFNEGQLEEWNQQSKADSILEYLSPLYLRWKSEKNAVAIAGSFKYYFSALSQNNIPGRKDTAEVYEQLISSFSDQLYLKQTIQFEKAYLLASTGEFNDARAMLKPIIINDELKLKIPLIFAKANATMAFMAAIERNFEEAIELNSISEQIIKSSYGEDHPSIILALNNYTIIYGNQGDNKKALENTIHLNSIIEKNYGPDHSTVTRNLNNMGICYYLMGKYDDAIQTIQRAVEINKRNGRSRALIDNYFNLAGHYITKNNFNQAYRYLELCLSLLSDLEGNHADIEIGVYNSLANYYLSVDSVENAEAYLKKAIDLQIKNYGNGQFIEGQLLKTLGNISRRKKEYDTAVSYYNEAIKVFSTYYENDNTDIATVEELIAFTYRDKGDKMAYLEHINLAHEQFSSSLGSDHIYTIESLIEIAKAYFLTENYELATKYLNEFFSVKTTSDSTAFLESGAVGNFQWVNALHLKVQLMDRTIKPKDQDITFKIHKIELFDEMAQELNKLLIDYGSFDNKYDLKNLTEAIFKEALSVAFELYEATNEVKWINKGYVYSERARSHKLKEILQERIAINYSGLPDSIVQHERNLAIFAGEKQAELNAISVSDSLEYLRAKSEWILANEEHNAYVRHIERNFSRYFDLKFNSSTVSIKEIQKELLSKDQCMVQYSLLDTVGYIHIIHKNSVEFVKINLEHHFDSLVLEWHHSIKDRDFQKTNPIGKQLFDIVFEPIQDFIKTKDCIVVPDRSLYFLSFDGLVTNDPGSPYLIQHHAFTYCYSPTVLAQDKKYRRAKSNNFEWVGFIPDFSRKEQEKKPNAFAELPWARNSAQTIANEFKSRLFEGSEANIQSFYQNASLGSILHLATHAIADDKDPLNSYLVFGEDSIGQFQMLKASELFSTSIDVDCTVLTACETAIGSIEGGEGMVSLSRAFAYAGCSNMVVTLWSIDDKESSSIIENFYQNLDKGKSYNDALHQAKSDYVRTARGELKHPFYWAGLVYYGHSEYKLKKTNISTWILTGISLLLLLSFIVYFKKMKPEVESND